jgi:hypothetical protein
VDGRIKDFLMKNVQIVHMFAQGQSFKFNDSLEDKYLSFKNKKH